MKLRTHYLLLGEVLNNSTVYDDSRNELSFNNI